MRLKRYMVFNFRKLLPLRRGRQTWLEAIISLRNLNYMVFSKPAKLLVFHLQWCSIFYARQRNFTHLGTIIILCASTRLLFYARQRNFMPWQFSSWAGFYPDRGGVEVTGQTASLLVRLPRRFNTIAPLGAEDCQWLFSLSRFHLGVSKSAKAQNCQWLFPLNCHPPLFKKHVEHFWGPAQVRSLRTVDLAGK